MEIRKRQLAPRRSPLAARHSRRNGEATMTMSGRGVAKSVMEGAGVAAGSCRYEALLPAGRSQLFSLYRIGSRFTPPTSADASRWIGPETSISSIRGNRWR